MNFKLVSVAAALAVSAAVAQDYDDEYEEAAPAAAEEQAEAAPAPAPAPAAPAVEDSWDKTAEAAPAQAAAAPATGFNVLHANAYNAVGNEAAAATINGDMSMPHKMAGRTLLYVQPSAREGVVSLASGGMTYLMQYTNNGGPAMLTAGITTGGLGVTVDLALNKTFTSHEVSTQAGTAESDASTTGAGDNIGVNFSMNLGALEFGAHAFWETFQDETDTENDQTEVDRDYWDIGISAVVSNAPSAKSLAWSAGLSLIRHASTEETSTGNQSTEVTNPESRFTITPNFNLAFPVASVANAQLFLGTNTYLPIVMYDEIKDDDSKNNRSEFGLYTTPNMLAEITLNDNWMFFGGASFTWVIFDRLGEENKANLHTEDDSTIRLATSTAYANAGARFSFKNFVLEASVSQTSSLDNFAGNLGAFIHF